MRTILKLAVVLTVVVASASQSTTAGNPRLVWVPSLSSIGALSFGPGGVLFAADNQAATIFAIDLGALVSGATPGTKDVAALDQKIAAMVGTTAASVAITDLAVHPTSKNSFVAIRRGEGANAQPALLRIDGAGKIDLLSLASATFTSVTLQNPAAATPDGRRGRTQSVTDLALRTAACSSPGCRTKNSHRSSGRWRIRSRASIAARAWRFTTAITGSSRRARPS